MISYYAFPGLKKFNDKETILPRIGKGLRGQKPEHILKTVCEYYNQEIPDVVGVSRKRQYVWCRHVFFYFCSLYTSMTKMHIGLFIGGRDHTTVIHGEQTVRDILETDGAKLKELKEIEYLILNTDTVGDNPRSKK